MRRSDPLAQSDREPALRHAHQPARRTGRQRALQPESQAPPACGCSRSAARFCAHPARRMVRWTSRASVSRCAWRPQPSVHAARGAMGRHAASGRLLRRQRRSRRRCWRHCTARFERSAASGVAPRPQRPSRCSRGEPIGWIGELHPRWQQKYELPAPAGRVRSGRSAPATARRCRPTGRCPRFPAGQPRSFGDRAREGSGAGSSWTILQGAQTRLRSRPSRCSTYTAGRVSKTGKKVLLSECYCKILKKL